MTSPWLISFLPTCLVCKDKKCGYCKHQLEKIKTDQNLLENQISLLLYASFEANKMHECQSDLTRTTQKCLYKPKLVLWLLHLQSLFSPPNFCVRVPVISGRLPARPITRTGRLLHPAKKKGNRLPALVDKRTLRAEEICTKRL